MVNQFLNGTTAHCLGDDHWLSGTITNPKVLGSPHHPRCAQSIACCTTPQLEAVVVLEAGHAAKLARVTWIHQHQPC